MSHKVHPKAFRIKEITDWQSRWVSEKKFPRYLEEDFKIRKFLKKKIGKFGIEKIEIERFPGKIIVMIFSARPGLIIGRGGEGIEELRKELAAFDNSSKASLAPSGREKELVKDKQEIKIEIREVRNPWASASLVAQWITQQLEKRIPFRKILKQTLDKIMSQKGVEGARVEVAGRLNGAEIARTEWLKRGRLPRQTIRADIDYAQAEALCTYGIIGVKVWTYKGERFAKIKNQK